MVRIACVYCSLSYRILDIVTVLRLLRISFLLFSDEFSPRYDFVCFCFLEESDEEFMSFYVVPYQQYIPSDVQPLVRFFSLF